MTEAFYLIDFWLFKIVGVVSKKENGGFGVR